jgi:hypothetical protein
LNKLRQTEPEIREDLEGRIEVFDQSVRSFEKRLRAIERRLSLETPPLPQTGRLFTENFSGNFSDPFPEVNANVIAADPSVFPHGPSVFPEPSIPGNSFLSNSVTVLVRENIPNSGLSAVIPSIENANISMNNPESSSELSMTGYKIMDISHLFSSLSESLHSLQTTLFELSKFAHNDLKSEIEKLDTETKSLKAQEEITNEYLKKLELHIKNNENQSKLTIGSIRIPFEVSGIVGSSILFLTGLLIFSGRWDIIRSPYFPIGLALLMAGAVFIKFYIVNRKDNSLAE